MQASPNEVRLVLVDPKQVELNHYENVPHLLTPVVTSPRLAANVLANLIGEMESRYGIMGEARCRNLGELNRARAKAGEAPLPHILCVIDELADLMMVAPAEVEDSIIRLAQKSRATGIHLVLATQRPSTDIITGTIKVNIPARIAFAVSSQTDSRVILDQGGAEALLGQGDMLFRGAGTSKLQRDPGRLHHRGRDRPDHQATGPSRANPSSRRSCSRPARRWPRREPRATSTPTATTCSTRRSALVVQTETASVSMIQRRLRVGYTRAGPPDRHARAPRRDLRLRGLQAAPGADHRRPICRACLRRGGGARAGRRGRRRANRPSAGRSPSGHDNDGRWSTEIGSHPARGAESPRSRPCRGRGGDEDPRRYLRAIENEEWDVLPGGAYTRGFIRTYADYLGLDGERLADEYRRRSKSPTGERPREAAAGARRRAPRRRLRVPDLARRTGGADRGRSDRDRVIGIGLAGGGGGGDSTGNSPHTERCEGAERSKRPAPAPRTVKPAAERARRSLGLPARREGQRRWSTARSSRPEPKRGRSAPVASRSRSATARSTMRIDGKQADIPATSSPIGYAIDSRRQADDR